MATKIWAGLDVGVETTRVCVIDTRGGVLHEATCPTTVKSVHRELVLLKRRKKSAKVGIEAGLGMSLARGLRTLGFAVDIYETRQLSKFLQVRRNKTDVGDANGIAQAGRLASALVSNVYLKSLECQSIGSRLKVRRYLTNVRTSGLNLLRRQIELYGGRVRATARSASLHAAVEGQLKDLFGKTNTPLVTAFSDLLEYCEILLARLAQVDRDLARLAREIDICRRVMEIPGVGPICALSFYAAIGEPGRFRKASDVGPYLGLTPKIQQSGLLLRSGRISRMGNREARTLLIQSSLRFMRCSEPDDALRAWTSEIEARRGRGKARVALARKLAMIMIAMWKSGEIYRPRLLRATE